MNIDDLKQILEVVREHDLSEFELEEEHFKLRVRKRGFDLTPELATRLASAQNAPVPAPVEPTAPPRPAATALQEVAPAAEAAAEPTIQKSPIVGTFYRAPEPGARPFVEVGTVVRKGQVLCIIEAMKLMNEINSEHDGEIVQVFIENGQAVQFGERLFAIKVK